MLATCKKDGVWRVDTEVPDHNHHPSDDLSAHPTLRRMTDQQLQKVHDMCDEGKSPAETLEELRAMWPDIKVLTRDIYNARKKHKTQKEEAELAAGRPRESPYQDPNEMGLPGPNANGKWAVRYVFVLCSFLVMVSSWVVRHVSGACSPSLVS